MAEKSPSEEEDDELKFDSSNFNALKALSIGNVTLPFPNVRALNNLAEYHSVTTGKKKKKADDGAEEGTSKEKAVPRGPVPAPRPANAPPPPEKKEIGGFNRHRRNFLVRMEENDQIGPMSLLRRSVFEQLRVKVWIRSAAYIRGFCQGFVVAYDRHFNMAMIDVDETYRKPILPKTNKRPIVIVPVVPSNTPPHSDWESKEEEEEEEAAKSSRSDTDKDTKSEITDQQFSLEKKAIIASIQDQEEPKRLSRQCLSTVIEPCLVYNRLKTKVCHRHVNQLFIRGDSVVSVAIIE